MLVSVYFVPGVPIQTSSDLEHQSFGTEGGRKRGETDQHSSISAAVLLLVFFFRWKFLYALIHEGLPIEQCHYDLFISMRALSLRWILFLSREQGAEQGLATCEQ